MRNIVRELATENTPPYRQIMRKKFDDFIVVFREIREAGIISLQVLINMDKVIGAAKRLTLRFHASKQTVSMVTTEYAITVRVRALNMLVETGQTNQVSHIQHENKGNVGRCQIECLMLYQRCSNIIQHVEWSSNTVAKRENVGSYFTQHVGSCSIYRLARA